MTPDSSTSTPMVTGQARWFVDAFRRAACLLGTLVDVPVTRGRHERCGALRKESQANGLSVDPSCRQYKQEGHANFARCARACARHPSASQTAVLAPDSRDCTRHVTCANRRRDAHMDDRIFRISPVVRASSTPDGLVLLDVRGGLLLSANDVGGRIWQMLAARETPCGIARCLAEEYGIAVEQAREDVAVFVDSLVTRRLIEEATT